MNVSYELFPTRTQEKGNALINVINKLDKTQPKFYSITFGASGSSQNATFATIDNINNNTNVDIAPHLTCIGSNKERIIKMLEKYKKLGIKRIVLLRGDFNNFTDNLEDFKYANELIEFVKEKYNNEFKIYVASYPEKHPESKTIDTDIKNFIKKVQAGADIAITQYFYNNDAYFRFVDDVRKYAVDIPIIPGIMPITNYKQLAIFSKNCEAEIPAWILNKLKSYKNDINSIREFGLDVVSEMCLQMKARGVEHFHFYTMNRDNPTISILKNIQ